MCRRIGVIVRGKNRNPIGYQFMLVGLWIGGEILGMIAGAIFLGGGAGMYLLALVSAIAGASATFVIVKNLAPAGGLGQRGFSVAPYNDEI